MNNNDTINILISKKRYSIPLLKYWFDNFKNHLNSKIYFADTINDKDIYFINKSLAIFIYVDCPINIIEKIKTKIILYQDFPFTKNDIIFTQELKNKEIIFLTHRNYKKFIKGSYEIFNYFPYIKKRNKIKKDIDLLILFGEPKIKFSFNNLFLIFLAKRLINFYGDFIYKIENNFFYFFLFHFSFKDKYEKINFIYRYIKFLRRKFIVNEIEKIGNKFKIFYCGSEKYVPKNFTYKSKFLDSRNFSNIVRRTKIIIATTPLVCDTVDERISYALRFNCLPIFEPYPQNICLLKNKSKILSFTYKKNVIKNKIIYLLNNNKLIDTLLKEITSNINKVKKIDPKKYLIKKLNEI